MSDFTQQVTRQIPYEYLAVISAQRLADTVEQLDAAVHEVTNAGLNKESMFHGKGELLKQLTTLETQISITEADAYMTVEGSGRDQFAMVGDKKVLLSNDDARKAFRIASTKVLLERKAELEGQLRVMEINAQRANDAWYKAKGAVDCVKAKASVQAALLNFLSGR